MTRPYDLLVFDWDGTLADSEALIVGTMQDAIRALDLPPRSDRQIGELIGLGLDQAFRTLYPELELSSLRGLYDDYRGRFAGTSPREAALFSGAVPALRSLREAGYRLTVATGKSRRGLDRALDAHADLRSLLHGTRCADETAAKPDPRMLKELLAEAGVPASSALMVGDTEFDMAMAGAIGMPAVGVTCGVHAPGRLTRSGAIALIEDVDALPRWLQDR